MATFAFVNGKGGSGKTTLALSFALALAEARHSIAFYDADAQKTFTNSLAHIRAHVGEGQGAEALARISEFSQASPSHHRVIDGPPRLGTEERALHSVMPSADVAVLPCSPSFTDSWSTLDSLKALRRKYPNTRYVVALTRVDSRTAFASAIRNQLAGAGLDVPILSAEIPDLACFTILPGFGWARLTRPAQKAVSDFALELLAFAQPQTA